MKISRGQGEVAFGEDQNHIYFETEGRLLITRKLTGTFPNYEMAMPKNNDHVASFDLDEMRNAVRRMSMIADDRNRSIRLTVREGEVEVTAQSSEHGEGNEVVQADYKGEEMTLGFNWQYLLEFLTNVGSVEMIAAESQAEEGDTKETEGDKVRVKDNSAPRARISFEFKDPNAQTQLSLAGESNYDYKYIVMPMRL